MAREAVDALRLSALSITLLRPRRHLRLRRRSQTPSFGFFTDGILMKVRCLALVASALICSAAELRGQVDSTLLGRRLRVVLRDVHRQGELIPPMLELRGTLTAINSDSLTIVLPSAQTTVALPTNRITSLAVSRGVPSRLESAARAALFWAFNVGAMSYLIASTQYDRSEWKERTMIGTGTGAAAGIILGFATPFERWRRLKIP